MKVLIVEIGLLVLVQFGDMFNMMAKERVNGHIRIMFLRVMSLLFVLISLVVLVIGGIIKIISV